MAVIVLSLNRTASVSVWRSLQAASTEPVHHLHCLQPDRWREKDRPDKAPKEQAALEAIADASARRVIVSILRDPFERVISALWYQKPDALTRLWRKSDDPAVADVAHVLRTRIGPVLDKERRNWELNWAPLGLLGWPKPGLHRSRSGIDIHFLDFARLEAGFAEATAAIFGAPAPLLKLNTAADRGDPETYARFKAWSQSRLVELIRSADPDAGRALGLPLDQAAAALAAE